MSLIRCIANTAEFAGEALSERIMDGALELVRNGDPFARIVNPLGMQSAVDCSRYHTIMCYTGHVGERQASSLKVRGAGSASLGYVFPLSALRTGESLERLWERRYAWVAVQNLLRGAHPEALVPTLTFSTVQGELTVDELFFDHLSICVVGLENLAKSSLRPTDLPIMLMREGLRFPLAAGQFARVEPISEWRATISVSSPSAAVRDDVDDLAMMIKVSDSLKSSIGEFLTLYQIVEYTIQRIFSVAVSAAVAGNCSPWTLRDRLSRVASEKWRLAKLAELCLCEADSGRMNELAAACRDLLQASGEAPESDGAWWQALYAVRNIVVHGQLRIVRDDYHNLEDINSLMRAACLELATRFALPAADALWEGADAQTSIAVWR